MLEATFSIIICLTWLCVFIFIAERGYYQNLKPLWIGHYMTLGILVFWYVIQTPLLWTALHQTDIAGAAFRLLIIELVILILLIAHAWRSNPPDKIIDKFVSCDKNMLADLGYDSMRDYPFWNEKRRKSYKNNLLKRRLHRWLPLIADGVIIVLIIKF